LQEEATQKTDQTAGKTRKATVSKVNFVSFKLAQPRKKEESGKDCCFERGKEENLFFSSKRNN